MMGLVDDDEVVVRGRPSPPPERLDRHEGKGHARLLGRSGPHAGERRGREHDRPRGVFNECERDERLPRPDIVRNEHPAELRDRLACAPHRLPAATEGA